MRSQGELKPTSKRADRFDYAIIPPAVEASGVWIWAAKDLAAHAGRLVDDLRRELPELAKMLMGWFGVQQLPQHQVVFAPIGVAGDGTGGTYTKPGFMRTVYIDADLHSLNARDRMLALYVGALSELLQELTAFGWHPKIPAGQALAWLHAQAVAGDALPEWDKCEQWLSSDRKSWLAFPPESADNPLAVGEAQCYLLWLRDRGVELEKITQTAHRHLADHCQRVLGRGHSVEEFRAKVEQTSPRPTSTSVVTVEASASSTPELLPTAPTPEGESGQHHALELWSDTPAGYYVRVPGDLAGDLGVSADRWKAAWDAVRQQFGTKPAS